MLDLVRFVLGPLLAQRPFVLSLALCTFLSGLKLFPITCPSLKPGQDRTLRPTDSSADTNRPWNLSATVEPEYLPFAEAQHLAYFPGR